jgi:hypothetical protein
VSVVVGWILAAVVGVALAVGATVGVVQVGTKAPAISQQVGASPYGSR